MVSEGDGRPWRCSLYCIGLLPLMAVSLTPKGAAFRVKARFWRAMVDAFDQYHRKRHATADVSWCTNAYSTIRSDKVRTLNAALNAASRLVIEDYALWKQWIDLATIGESFRQWGVFRALVLYFVDSCATCKCTLVSIIAHCLCIKYIVWYI